MKDYGLLRSMLAWKAPPPLGFHPSHDGAGSSTDLNVISIPAPATLVSSSSSAGTRSRTRSRSPRTTGTIRRTRSTRSRRRRSSSSSSTKTRSERTSDLACDSEGELQRVEPNMEPGPHGPPPPEPVNAPAEPRRKPWTHLLPHSPLLLTWAI